jgi:hypothetical protein
MIFFFPIPLLYVVLQEKVSYIHGFIWGISVYSFHLSGVLWGTIILAKGSYIVRIIPALFIIIYQSLYTGLWFWFMGYINDRYTLQKKRYLHCIVWIISLCIYTFWLDRYCLFLFDRLEGYSLMHPLLPLAEKPMLLCLIPYGGKICFTLLLYSFAGLCTLFLLHPSWYTVFLCLLSVIPWCISIWLWTNHVPTIPTWLNGIVCLPKKFPDIENISFSARLLREEVRCILQKYPEVHIVFAPESSIYTHYLFNEPSLVNHLSPPEIGKPLQLLIGSFYDDDGKYRNTCYWVKDGIMQQRFDKRHAMVLIERIPSLFKSNIIKDMYFTQMPEIISSNNIRPHFNVSDTLCVVPYLCSELFFNEYPDDPYDCTILLLANDTWTPSRYIRDLMYLAARFKALQWQRGIIYITYYYHSFFDVYGNEYPIKRC